MEAIKLMAGFYQGRAWMRSIASRLMLNPRPSARAGNHTDAHNEAG
jgi:hypothetical protein